MERKPDGEGGEKMRRTEEGKRERESERWSNAYKAGVREGEDESTSEQALYGGE